MQSKIIKNIPVFFLLLAGSVMSAHMIIPHDHHLTAPYSSQESSCPESDSKPDHHKGFPVHCHAFNDLTSEKAIVYIFSSNIIRNFVQTFSFFDQSSLLSQFHLFPFLDILNIIPESHLLGLSYLRGPPLLS